MLLHLAIGLVSVVLVQSFILPEPYHIVLEDSADFNIDESFEAGLKMGDNDDQKQFGSDIIEDKVDHLNRLSIKKFQKSTPVRRFRSKTTQYLAKRSHRKSNTFTTLPSTEQLEIFSDILESYQLDYQYNGMLKEYYDQSIHDGKSNQTYHARKKGKSGNALMSSIEEIVHLGGLNALGPVLEENELKEPKLDSEVLAEKLWRFIKIMLIVYVVLAIPLWCTKGWCCCCLCCKPFKPRRTIDEAKRYITRNPPGILSHSSSKRGRAYEYEPTNEERECYEEFEHLIRTM